MEVQLPKAYNGIFDPHRFKAMYGGRASAKSHTIATALLLLGGEKQIRVLACREVQKSIKDSVKQLLDDKIEQLGLSSFYESLRDEIRGKNGTRFLFTGLAEQTIDSLKSYENISHCWVEESQSIAARSLEILVPTIRAPGSEIWFSWNPRHKSDPVDIRFRGPDIPDDSWVLEVSHDDNPFMSDESRADMEYDKRTNPQRFAHIWKGAYEPQALGAIFHRQTIADNRTTLETLADNGVELERIVVAVDPAVSDTETSDEHGIAVVAKATDGRGYLLEDASRHGSPAQWAQMAWVMHDKWEADCVIAEANQGGDMVKHTLRTARPDQQAGRILLVKATKGKHVRAEPISALCETGMIGFAGSFPELEAQLCLFTSSGYAGDDSPDRAEAFIWGMTELFPKIIKKTEPKKPNYRRRPSNVSWMGT